MLSLALLVSELHAVPEFFPLSEIKPGMKGTVYTVMQGSEVVPIEAEILGILDGGLGPGRDMIIGKLVDEKTKLTGAVHGMSGSPLMINGKLAGALSRRLGAFEKDGHCGFTPAKDMQDVSRRGHRDDSDMRLPESSLVVTPLTVSGGANGWGILEEKLKEWFPGTLPVVGGGAGKKPKELPPLEAGSAMAVVLMDGDITVASTGTVTWVDGDQVVAFGHAMFGLGPTEFPIAPAEIITVLPSYLRPYKIANAGTINGTLDQDRHSAVSGRVGPVPDMAKYKIERKHNNEVRPIWEGRLVKHHLVAPQLIATLASNAMMDAQDVSGDFSMRSETRVKFTGLDEYVMEGYYSGGQMDRIIGMFDQLIPLMQLMGKYGRELELESVQLNVETIETRRSWVISSMDTESSEVEVGKELNFIIKLKNVLGETKQIRSSWVPPEELRGQKLVLEGISGLNLNLMRQNSSAVFAGSSPQDALEHLKTRYQNNQIYIRGTMRSAALLKSGRLQSGLPYAVNKAAQENPAPETAYAVDSITYGEKAIPVEGMVTGSGSKMISVK